MYNDHVTKVSSNMPFISIGSIYSNMRLLGKITKSKAACGSRTTHVETVGVSEIPSRTSNLTDV